MSVAMQERGLTVNAWSKQAGISESGLRGFLSGKNPNASLFFLGKAAIDDVSSRIV